MTRHTDNENMEELSAAIDAVNRGDRLDGVNQQARELAEVALLVKRSGPPPAVVAKLADGLAGELAAKKRRRRWLTSGATGTVAAVLLVAALNLNPSAPTPPPLAIPPAGSVVIESVPSPVPAAISPAPDVAKVKEAVKDKEEAKAAGPEKQLAKAAEPAPSVREPAPVSQDKQVAAGMVEKRVMLTKEPETVLPRPAGPSAVILAWPGRQPDAVSVDKEAGTVRQVYGAGGEKEIVITQRPTSRAAAAPEESKPAVMAEKNSAVKGKSSRVTLSVKGVTVTVEGSQPEEELRKIAQSLE